MKIENVARPVSPVKVERSSPALGLLVIVAVCGAFWGAVAWACA